MYPLHIQNVRMQQPLAHLYFFTVLEHLQAVGHKLSVLVRIANSTIQQCACLATREVEGVLLWVELQAVVQMILQELAAHLDPAEAYHIGEVQPLVDNINKYLRMWEGTMNLGTLNLIYGCCSLVFHTLIYIMCHWTCYQLTGCGIQDLILAHGHTTSTKREGSTHLIIVHYRPRKVLDRWYCPSVVIFVGSWMMW